MAIAILFTSKDPLPWKKDLEQQLGEEVYVHPVADHIRDKIDFLLCWKPSPRSLSFYNNVKVVQSVGAGVDHLFAENKIDKHIPIARIKDEKLLEDMYEYVLTTILAHIKNFHIYNSDKMQSSWKPVSYRRIEDTIVSILGLGYLGAGVAQRLAHRGFKLQGWSASDKHISEVKSFVNKSGLKEMLSTSDILVNLLPLTEDTKGILNESLFSQLKKNCYLINVGRGPHLVEQDLITALDDNVLSGACLDVFGVEPLEEGHPFWADSRIFITPHIASITDKSSASLQVIVNYRNMQEGKPIANIIDLEKGY